MSLLRKYGNTKINVYMYRDDAPPDASFERPIDLLRLTSPSNNNDVLSTTDSPNPENFIERSLVSAEDIQPQIPPVRPREPRETQVLPKSASLHLHRVVFHWGKFGKVETKYHRVVVNDTLVVLAYDHKYKEICPFYSPPEECSEDQDLSIQVDQNEPVAVLPNRIRFVMDNYEFFLFAKKVE